MLDFEKILNNLKTVAPLVHCITNYVTINDCANILLACGASPIMADDPDESAEITSLAKALLLVAVEIGVCYDKIRKSGKP